MAKTNYQSVDQYLAAQPEAVQPSLQRVRSVLRRALPGADEVISYQIPAYKLHGRVVIYFAGWKDHYSLYPVSGSVAAAFARELAPYEVNNKGTARFPYVGRIPTKLIESIAKLLAKNTLEGTRPAASKPRKPAASKPRKPAASKPRKPAASKPRKSARPANAIERKRSA